MSLAWLNAGALLATFAVGFLCEGRANVSAEVALTVSQQRFAIHLLGGLFTAVLTLVVHPIALTYFMGTGRWVQEVVAAYRMPESIWIQARQIKQRTFPFVLGSILLIIATAALGAATDRGLIDRNLHMAGAVLAIGFNLWSYLREYEAIRANGELLDQIMGEVTRMRRERGLSSPISARGNSMTLSG